MPVDPGNPERLLPEIRPNPDEIRDIHQILGASRVTFEGDEIGDVADPEAKIRKNDAPLDPGPGDLGEYVEAEPLDFSPHHPWKWILLISLDQETFDPAFLKGGEDLLGVVP